MGQGTLTVVRYGLQEDSTVSIQFSGCLQSVRCQTSCLCCSFCSSWSPLAQDNQKFSEEEKKGGIGRAMERHLFSRVQYLAGVSFEKVPGLIRTVSERLNAILPSPPPPFPLTLPPLQFFLFNPSRMCEHRLIDERKRRTCGS
jgi:hypothetical protein